MAKGVNVVFKGNQDVMSTLLQRFLRVMSDMDASNERVFNFIKNFAGKSGLSVRVKTINGRKVFDFGNVSQEAIGNFLKMYDNFIQNSRELGR